MLRILIERLELFLQMASTISSIVCMLVLCLQMKKFYLLAIKYSLLYKLWPPEPIGHLDYPVHDYL